MHLMNRSVGHGLTLRSFADLLLLVGLALSLPWLAQLSSPLLRVPLGLLAALFAPGYALLAAAFPGRADLNDIARAALSFGLSVALLPILALILNALPAGLHPGPIIWTLAITIFVLSGLAAALRWQLARSGDRAAACADAHTPPRWPDGQARLGYVLGTLAVMAVLLMAMLVASPATPSPSTEFYTLGSERLAERYPREVIVGQALRAWVGVINHEAAAMDYHIEVRLGQLLLATTKPITLENNATSEQSLRYMLPSVGDNQQVDILLFAEDDPAPYRRLQLWVNVRATQ